MSTRCDTCSTSRSDGGGNFAKASASSAPLMPGGPSGTTTTHRHDSGKSSRAMSGPQSSLLDRRPPSTTSPPPANVQVPMADRCARPIARASARGSASTAWSSASARAIDSASWVPDPRPACDGSARCTRIAAPPGRWWWSRNCRANAVARSASSPSTVNVSAGEADKSSEGADAAAPIPPNQRPPEPRRSSTPKCRRAYASIQTAGPSGMDPA